MTYFRTYVVPSIIPGICLRMTFYFPSLLLLSILCIWLLICLIRYRPNFQQCHLVHWLSPVGEERNILSFCFACNKGIEIDRKIHVVKIWVEVLTSYSNLLRFLLLFVAVFIISKVVALHKIRHPIIWWLENYELIKETSSIVNRVVIM